MKIREIFDASAESYDLDRPQLIPCFDLFYGELIRRLPFTTDDEPRILDVGAGTGLVSSMIGQALPRARFMLTDLAPKMLEKARERFAGSDRYEFQLLDSRELPFAGEFDAVVSALSIHHLDHSGKREVYRRIHRALKPGGVFVHADQVLAPTPELEEEYERHWLHYTRGTGLAEERIQASIVRRREDLNATLDDNLGWLRAAGFRDVDCHFKIYRFAVFGGVK
jgi:tRNA (cmo5U34)-methyltransferase